MLYHDRINVSEGIYVNKTNQGSSKNTGIPSIKIPLNIARRNHYLDSR